MPSARPLVVVSQAAHRPFPEVLAEVRRQHPQAVLRVDDMASPFGYMTWWRLTWRGPGDLVGVEGDVYPPPGAIAQLLECPRDWCSFPLWLGSRFVEDSNGLTKYSLALRRRHPELLEQVATRARPGPVHFKARTPPAHPSRYVQAVPIPPAALELWPELGEAARWLLGRRGTTSNDRQSDVLMSVALQRRGERVHVHQPPPWHLRYRSWRPDWARQLSVAGGGDQIHAELEG